MVSSPTVPVAKDKTVNVGQMHASMYQKHDIEPALSESEVLNYCKKFAMKKAQNAQNGVITV